MQTRAQQKSEEMRAVQQILYNMKKLPMIRLSTAIMANAVCREGGLVTTSQSIFKMVLRPWTFFVPEFLKFSAY